MQIVFKREVADQLRDRYTVLELETFQAGDHVVETFCVIPVEKLVFSDLSTLDSDIRLHEAFISAAARHDYAECAAMYTIMKGKFGGELDSFYKIVNDRASS